MYRQENASYATLPPTSVKRISRGITIRYWIREPTYLFYVLIRDRVAGKTGTYVTPKKKKIDK